MSDPQENPSEGYSLANLNEWLASLDASDQAVAAEFFSDPKSLHKALHAFKTDRNEADKNKADLKVRNEQAQELYDAAIDQFDGIDINDPIAVVSWLKQLTKVGDIIGLDRKNEYVIRKLKDAGYMNASGQLSKRILANKLSTARYLIGVAMNGLEREGYINPVFSFFVSRLETRGQVKRILFGLDPNRLLGD